MTQATPSFTSYILASLWMDVLLDGMPEIIMLLSTAAAQAEMSWQKSKGRQNLKNFKNKDIIISKNAFSSPFGIDEKKMIMC